MKLNLYIPICMRPLNEYVYVPTKLFFYQGFHKHNYANVNIIFTLVCR